MPSLLLYIQASHTWKIIIHTSGCCSLILVPHLTVIPTKLIIMLNGICTSICRWILDFLTNRPHSVRLGSHMASTLILNTGVPQDCMLSTLRYCLFTHDCVPLHNYNIFIKYADDTIVLGQISNNDETAYREEIQNLAAWCSTNNLTLKCCEKQRADCGRPKIEMQLTLSFLHQWN